MLKHASLIAGRAALALATAVVVAFAVTAQEPDRSVAPDSKRPIREKASGVILKIEKVDRGAHGGPGRESSWRMTVNTDVIWRDFVRDQAVDPQKAARTGIAKAAAKGRVSVAAKGHPTADPLLLTVDVDPETDVTVRYRSSTDATTEGAPTPEGASKVEDAKDETGKGTSKTTVSPNRPDLRREVRKARSLEPMELKPGMWVELEFRRIEGQQRARRVIVMRPVGGPDTSPEKEHGSTTKSTSPGH